jgi:hypothetical protein
MIYTSSPKTIIYLPDAHIPHPHPTGKGQGSLLDFPGDLHGFHLILVFGL